MKQVDFIIIGVQKSGTTSLAEWLNYHPQLSLCSQKEPDFFSRTDQWKEKLHEYHNLFQRNNEEHIKWFEASTSYSWFLEFPFVATRLKEYNSKLKLIYIVREPISRIKSHYKHNFLKGYTSKSFSKEVIENPTYLSHSSYALQIRSFLKEFGKEQILFLKFEDLISNPQKVLTKVFNFLEIDADLQNPEVYSAKNKSSSLKKVSPLKKYIAPLFRFIPFETRLKFRKIFYSNHKVVLDSTNELEEQLYELLYTDIVSFNKLTGINYVRNEKEGYPIKTH